MASNILSFKRGHDGEIKEFKAEIIKSLNCQLMAKNPQYQEAKWALVIDDMFYAAEHVLQLPEDEEEVANGVYVKGKIGSKRQVKGLIYGREVIVSILDKGPEDVIKRLVKFGNGLLAEREKQLQTVLVSRISDDDTEEELPPQKKRKTDPIKSNDEDEDDEVFGDEKALKDSENFGGTLEDSQNESQDGTLDSLPEPKLRKPSDSEIPVGMENQVEYWKKKAEERKIEILKLNHDVKKLEFENNMMRKTQYEWMDKNVENKLKNFNFYDRKEWNNLMKEEILGNQNARKSFAVAACITAVIHFNSVSTNKYYLPLGTRGNDKTKKRNKRFYPDHETYWSLWMYILGKKELIKDRKRIMVNAVNHMDDASHFELRKKVKMLVGITATQIVVTDDIPDTPKKIRPEFRNDEKTEKRKHKKMVFADSMAQEVDVEEDADDGDGEDEGDGVDLGQEDSHSDGEEDDQIDDGFYVNDEDSQVNKNDKKSFKELNKMILTQITSDCLKYFENRYKGAADVSKSQYSDPSDDGLDNLA